MAIYTVTMLQFVDISDNKTPSISVLYICQLSVFKAMC